MAKLPALVFDVNETLLDLEALSPHFARIFGDGDVIERVGHIDHDLTGPVGPLCSHFLEVEEADRKEDDVRVQCLVDRNRCDVRPKLRGDVRKRFWPTRIRHQNVNALAGKDAR